MRTIARNVSLVVTVTAILGGLPGDTARGQVIGAAEGPTLSLGQLILRDNFDDNEKNAIWRVYTDDSDNCSLVETNHRLELCAKPAAADAMAMYVSNAWRFDPSADFSMRVDLQYTLLTYARGWVGFGVTPNADKPRERQIGIGIGAADLYAHFQYRMIEDTAVDVGIAPRLANSATVYMSYNALADELYISDAGYGPLNAWMTFPGLVRGCWEGKPLYIWAGGSSDGLNVAAGQAFLDNLLIESGDVLEASLHEVYRFWSAGLEEHFLTISDADKEALLLNASDVWTYQGPVFAAFSDGGDPLTRPVYRFWSDKVSRHFYTIDSQEKERLVCEQPNVWTLEGVAFYAYPCGSQPAWASPVYRLHCPTKNTYFYTINQTEKDDLLTKQAKLWTYEGIAWYAVK